MSDSTDQYAFACGDVVPGCERSFTGSHDQILGEVADHAAADHGLQTVSDELVAVVVANFRAA